MTTKTIQLVCRLFTVALVLALIGSPVMAKRAVNESCDVSGSVRVSVESMSGKIVVIGGGSSIQVRGEVGGDVEGVELDCDGGKVEITVLYPDHMKRMNAGDADLEITVPASSYVHLEGLSTDQAVKGVNGRVVLEAMSGDLVVEGTPVEVRAETMSGDIHITAGAGKVVAEAASGDITILGVSGVVRAETMSGDIELEASGLEEADLATVAGSVECRCDLVSGGRLSAEAVSGSVTLDLPDSVDATFTLETFNGSIQSTIGGVDRRPQKDDRYGPGRSLEFTQGSGTGSVDVSVFNGRCVVK
jgi:hypothetical protein